MVGVPVLQLFREAHGLFFVQYPPIEEAKAWLVITVPSHFPDAVVAAKLIENTEATRKEPHTRAELGGDLGMCLEKNVLDIELLKHVGQR